MSRRLSIIRSAVALSALFLTLAPVAGGEQKNRPKGPMTITAETLTADNKAHTALFEKNVTAKTSDITMNADKMLVFYREDNGEVTKIECTGNVRVQKESRLIMAHSALYIAEEEKIIFTGDPRVIDGENAISGSKMTYYLKDDRALVENSRVIMKTKRD